jgi:hypothetical protein
MFGLATLGFTIWLIAQIMQTFKESDRASELRSPERKSTPETHDEKVERVSTLVDDVLPIRGEIMERSPLTIFPAKELPIPKDEMKIALQLTWCMADDDRLRGFVEVAYMQLANFRDDVDSPIDPTISDGMTPSQVASKLGPYLAISKSMLSESAGLMQEIKKLRRLSKTRASINHPGQHVI